MDSYTYPDYKVSENMDELNAWMRSPQGGGVADWEDGEWALWCRNDNGEFWYSILDGGLPGEDNIIEGANGERLYLSRDEAVAQWGEDACLVSLNNGNTYVSPANLDDEEVRKVLEYLDNDRGFQEYPHQRLRDRLCLDDGTDFCEACDPAADADAKRRWLCEYMSRLCMPLALP